MGRAREVDFTLTVNAPEGAAQHAVITSAGPVNGTVRQGDQAVLRCQVKSVAPPHIKWLKKLEEGEGEGEEAVSRHLDVMGYGDGNVLTLNDQTRYRVLPTKPDVMTPRGEFVNTLVIPLTTRRDAGMYICFVTNSGFGAMTYKSTRLRVVGEARDLAPAGGGNAGDAPRADSNVLLAAIVTFVVVTFAISVVVIVCVLRRSRLARAPPKRTHSSATSSSDATATYSRNDDDFVQQRPFLMPSSASEIKYDPGCSPGGMLPAPPASLFAGSTGQWSRTVYPAFGPVRYGDTGHYENPAKFRPESVSPAANNQYEVPYSHLSQQQQQQLPQHGSFGQLLAPRQQQQQRVFGGSQQLLQQAQPQQRFSPAGSAGTNPRVLEVATAAASQQQQQIRGYPYFQYLGNYET